MQLSKGFDYAVRSLVHLAAQPGGHSAELRTIGDAQGIPVSYLAKVMRNLVRAGLVTSTLGRDGGYALRRPPEDITLMQVYEAMEGELRLVECMTDEKNCTFFRGCTQAPVWRRLRDAVEGIFTETTLRDLLPARGLASLPILEKTKEKEKTNVRAGA